MAVRASAPYARAIFSRLNQMTAGLRRQILSYPGNLILIAILWGGSFACVDGFVSPRVVNAVSLSFLILRAIGFFHGLFLVAALVVGAILLLRRKWFSALCYFSVGCILWLSIVAALALKGDRFAFPGGPHREIADIYHRRLAEFSPINQNPRLVFLDRECHPPNGCYCWVLVDPAHTSGADKEMGDWHRPSASIFPQNTLPVDFAIVNVKRLNENVYSVLGCSTDQRGLFPLTH
jgi:hypothetical protein